MRFSIGAAFLVAGLAGGYLTAVQSLSRAGTSPAPDGSRWLQEVVNPKDPYSIYAIGHFKSEGSLPPPRSALLFYRTVDDDGKVLRGDCYYRLASAALPARWWAVSAAPLDASTGAVTSTAADVILTGDAKLDLALSRRASPGNWLIVPDATNLRVTLVLHEVYDKDKKVALVLPTVTKVACE